MSRGFFFWLLNKLTLLVLTIIKKNLKKENPSLCNKLTNKSVNKEPADQSQQVRYAQIGGCSCCKMWNEYIQCGHISNEVSTTTGTGCALAYKMGALSNSHYAQTACRFSLCCVQNTEATICKVSGVLQVCCWLIALVSLTSLGHLAKVFASFGTMEAFPLQPKKEKIKSIFFSKNVCLPVIPTWGFCQHQKPVWETFFQFSFYV